MIFKELVLAVCSTNSQYVVFKDILSISFLNVTKKKRSSWYNWMNKCIQIFDRYFALIPIYIKY